MRAEPATATEAPAATGSLSKGPRWLLPAGALLLAAALAAYLADLVTHLSSMAAMRDLVVYRNGGLIVRHVSPAYDPHQLRRSTTGPARTASSSPIPRSPR